MASSPGLSKTCLITCRLEYIDLVEVIDCFICTLTSCNFQLSRRVLCIVCYVVDHLNLSIRDCDWGSLFYGLYGLFQGGPLSRFYLSFD